MQAKPTRATVGASADVQASAVQTRGVQTRAVQTRAVQDSTAQDNPRRAAKDAPQDLPKKLPKDALIEDFAEDQQPDDSSSSAPALELELDGYAGPLDLLLELARAQKVDLNRISVLALVEQYLGFLRDAEQLDLSLAADYLVMAAWLVYLKSRLLLPSPPRDAEPSGQALAERLTARLKALAAMQQAASRLWDRPRLGSARHARGLVEVDDKAEKWRYQASLYDLLEAYGSSRNRAKRATVALVREAHYAFEDAIVRIETLLGQARDAWLDFDQLVPSGLSGRLNLRTVRASLFLASLEMVHQGKVEIEQEALFGNIRLRARSVAP